MDVIIDSKVYQDGQKIKWNEYGDIIYGTIYYGLFNLDGSGGEYSSRLVYGWYVEFEKIEPRYEDIYETDLEQYGYYKKQQSLAQILNDCYIKVFDD